MNADFTSVLIPAAPLLKVDIEPLKENYIFQNFSLSPRCGQKNAPKTDSLLFETANRNHARISLLSNPAYA